MVDLDAILRDLADEPHAEATVPPRRVVASGMQLVGRTLVLLKRGHAEIAQQLTLPRIEEVDPATPLRSVAFGDLILAQDRPRRTQPVDDFVVVLASEETCF